MTPADTASRRLGPGAIALVLDELDRLPRVDDRYRRWPWSQRALAQRRRCSPGTVHKHHQALAAAGVLVTDDHGRTLVDTTRLQHARHDEAPPTCGRRRRSTTASHSQRPDDAPAGGEADVLVAIEALTKAVEARPDLAGALTQLIGRLARLLEHPPATSSAPVARPQPRDDESGARGHCGGDLAADLGRCAGTAARPTARDRAPLKKERKNQHSHSDNARDGDLPGLSFSPGHESRAMGGARPGRAPVGRAGARPADRLLELLAPLDPSRHVTYLEGVQTALAGYDDTQIAHAVTRIARLGNAATNPVGLLVDRATAKDPLYFPQPAPDQAAPDDGQAPAVVEPPPDLWSTTETSDDQPAEPDALALPQLEPDPTLAPAIAARAALEAAHQPVTREQLAARQAAVQSPENPNGGSGRTDRAA